MKKTTIISLLLLCACAFTQGKEFPTFFPKMKAVQEAVYLNISTDQTEAKLISRVFQGIINRDSAELFLGDDSHEVTWFKYTNKPFRRPAYNITSGDNRGLRTLFRNYKDRLDKLVVCDFKINAFSWNMAVMMASAENALPVSEDLKNKLVAEFGWDKEIVDIRNRWSTLSEAYDWAITELMPKLNKKIIFSLGLRDDWKSFPWRLYDYAVATRSFTFWLDNHSTEGKNIIKRILNTEGYPKNSFVLGYGMHGDDLNDAINPEGWGFLVGDIFPNASFYSSFPTETFKQPEPKAVTAEKGKVYVALHWSDGDNIQFNHNATYDIFNQQGRGKVPVGMTMAASLQELNPVLLEYFYKNLTPNDELVAGPSGFQFIYGDKYNENNYEKWLETNQKWLETAGFHTACLWNTTNKERFGRYMQTCGLQGVFDGFENNKERYEVGKDGEGVVCILQGAHCWEEGDVYKDLISVKPNGQKPVFRNVYLIAASYGGVGGYERLIRELQRVESYLPNTYEFLLPMDLCATLKEYIEKNGGNGHE